MWPHSDRFATALTRDHFVVVKAEILNGEQILYELAGDGVLIDGSVSASRSETERTANVSIVDRDGSLTPRDVNDLLVPGGNQIRLYRGIMFGNRLTSGLPDVEFVPLGTFRFTASTSNYPIVTLEAAYDRSWIVSGNKLENVLSIPQGTNVVDAISRLLQGAYPGVPMNLPSTSETTNGMTLDSEADPWQVSQGLAANLGMRLFFDQMGVATMRPEPDEGDPPVWSYDDTDTSNIGLESVTRTWTGDGYNAVIVVAENTDLPSPIRAAAYDNDPASPTQYGGDYGRRPAPIIRDETISSQAQASLRAVKELQSNIGLLQSISVPTVVIPSYEVGDVVRVAISREDLTDTPPISEQFCVVDGFEVPLRAGGGQTLSTRARRVISA